MQRVSTRGQGSVLPTIIVLMHRTVPNPKQGLRSYLLVNEWVSKRVNEEGSNLEVFFEGGGGQNRARAIPSEHIVQDWYISQFHRNTTHIKVKSLMKRGLWKQSEIRGWDFRGQSLSQAERGQRAVLGMYTPVHLPLLPSPAFSLACTPTAASLPSSLESGCSPAHTWNPNLLTPISVSYHALWP